MYERASDCGYSHCALGDKDEWEKLKGIYTTMLPHIDFLSFYQIVGQFSRDYTNPGSWENPNPRSFSTGEQGIDYLADRISNLSKFLHDSYKKPVYMAYIAVPTATWSDSNGNNAIEDSEVNPNGWLTQANNTYAILAQLRGQLQANGLFGFSTMELFDDPRHDYGGYQFLMNNTYHLGIIGSSARDESDIATYGDLNFKGTILNSLFP
ncbi:MAG: hypothetical protein Q9M36_00150 [Sulfurovum sp.]|nr:hypothetical protein [Sulfurovum sp.]